MRRIKNSSDLRGKAHVVGTVHSPGALRRAAAIQAGEVDFLEIRVDNFAPDPSLLVRALPKLRVPLIVTVRHPAEGGLHALNLARRREIFEQFLPFATFIDVELRSFTALSSIVAAARRTGVKLIGSSHHFHSTPTAVGVERTIRRAHAAGADVCKLAAFTPTPAALARLLAPLTKSQPLPLSVMGMGPLGKVSRLLFAQAGSILNYGYLDCPNASGQWEATLLRKRLAELA